jgi:DNA-binding XRE family transcriptional regulator
MPQNAHDRPSAGFVYVFEAENHLYKVGKSFDPKQRVARFNTLPVAVTLVHQIESSDAAWLERRLHRRFELKRVRGEWFALTADDVAELARMSVCNLPEQRELFGGLGARVARLREKEGLSQTDLARRAGLPFAVVIAIEDETEPDPRLSVIAAVARSLGVGFDELTGGPEEVAPHKRRPKR